MKSRWTEVIGRIGSVLLAIGLGLVLISAIPPTPPESILGWAYVLIPETYDLSPSSQIISPKKGLHILGASNGSFQVYLVGVHRDQLLSWIRSWVRQQFPNGEEWVLYEISALDAFLRTHPDDILLSMAVSDQSSFDFFPQGLTNVTVVTSNPSSAWVDVSIELGSITTLAPKERVVIPGTATSVCGLVLVFAWAIQKRKASPSFHTRS